MTLLSILDTHKKVLEQIVEGLTGKKPSFVYVGPGERVEKFSSILETGAVPVLIPANLIHNDRKYYDNTDYVEFLTAMQAGRVMYGSAILSVEDFKNSIQKMCDDGVLVRDNVPVAKIVENIDDFFEVFPSRKNLAKEIFEIVESARVNACLKRDFIGYKETLESVVPEKFRECLDGVGCMFRQPFDFTVLTLLQYQLLLGYLPEHKLYGKKGEQNSARAAQKRGEVFRPFIERVRNVFWDCRSIAGRVLKSDATVGDSLRVTCALHKIIVENSEKDHGGSDSSPRKLDGLRGFGRKEHMILDSKDKIAKMKIFRREPIKTMEDAFKASIYPEWDSVNKKYIEGFGVVDDKPPYWHVQRTITPDLQLVSRIRHEFSLIRPDGRAVLRKQRSGELDYGQYVEYQRDVAAGIAPDARIYKKVLNRKRDVAALILVDMSGSTNRWIDEKTRIIDVIAEAVYYLSCGASTLDDLVGVFGYSTNSRRRTSFYRIADFGMVRHDNEDFIHSLEHITGVKQNHDGVAIRHACKRLVDTGRKNKLLIHISDGEPEAVFLGTELRQDERNLPEYKGDYAWQDVGRALSEARAKGVLPVCIRINDQKVSGLAQFYGTQYRILSDPLNLQKVLCNTYKELIT